MADPVTRAGRENPFAKMLTAGAAQERDLQRDAEALMDKMIGLHGGVWSVSIDHDSHYILIARDFT